MAFSISPAITVTEQDFSATFTTVAATGGAMVGAFQWGPVDTPTTISDETKLVSTFYKPNDEVANSWFTAANFLSYGNDLKIVRSVGINSFNATDDTNFDVEEFVGDNSTTEFTTTKTFEAQPTSVVVYKDDKVAIETTDYTLSYNEQKIKITFLEAPAEKVKIQIRINAFQIKNEDDFENTVGFTGKIYAKYPGEVANGLKIWIATSENWESLGEKQKVFTYEPVEGEISVAIIDAGKFDEAGSVLWLQEIMSTDPEAMNSDGSSNFYQTVVNRNCDYIWITSDITADTEIILSNGADDNLLSDADKMLSVVALKNAEQVDFRVLLGADASSTFANELISNVAEYRKDCVVFLSPDINSMRSAEDIVEFRNTLPSSSYFFLDNNWMYMYDKYNDKYRWIPCNGGTAGLYVRMAANSEAWFSPAGYNRGIYKNVVKLMINCDKTDRDTLYKSNVNPIIVENGYGALLLGDKTGLTRPSSFDRINVRMLFIILEKAIATFAKNSLFEMNDEYTRSAFRNRVSQYLRDVKGRRGCDDYLVVCDETNNTANVINSNGFVAAIKVRPLKSINFIELQFASYDYGIDFEETA